MTQPSSSDAPLPPETRALLARARRSFMFTIGLLILGVIAVGAAVVYKSSSPVSSGSSGNGDYSLATVKVPAGAEVIAAVAADGRLTVTYRSGQATSIRIFDGKTGEMLREVPVSNE
jgi:streptogramin lyase